MSITPKEDWIPLYTAPREWIGLTDEEIKDIAAYGHQVTAYAWTGNFARAIEAKLKDKNCRS